MEPFLRTLIDLKNQYNAPVYVVGGFIRDLLLDRRSFDIDMVTKHEPFILGGRFAQETGGKYRILILDQPTVSIGLEQGAFFYEIDITQMRGDSIKEDLAQRDFTINAMALTLEDMVAEDPRQFVYDPFGGKLDLQREEIRAVSREGLLKDPLRLLRAARFSAKLNFNLEKHTREAVVSNKALVRDLSGERLKVELEKMVTNDAGANFRILEELGLLQDLFYGLFYAFPEENEPEEGKEDSLAHVLENLEELLNKKGEFSQLLEERLLAYLHERRKRSWNNLRLLKMAALMCRAYDYKVFLRKTRTGIKIKQGSRREKARKKRFLHFCAELGFNDREQNFLHHMLWFYKLPLHFYSMFTKDSHMVYEFYKILGKETPAVLVLSLAAYSARMNSWGVNYPSLPSFQEYKKFILNLLNRYFYWNEKLPYPPAPISAQELMGELYLKDEAIIKELMEIIAEAYAEGEISTRKEAVDLAGLEYRRKQGESFY